MPHIAKRKTTIAFSLYRGCLNGKAMALVMKTVKINDETPQCPHETHGPYGIAGLGHRNTLAHHDAKKDCSNISVTKVLDQS